MQIVVVGAGYVGLVTASCLADAGHKVTCVDRDRSRIDILEQGGMPIFEPGLEELVARNRRSRRLAFSSDLSPCAHSADAAFLAVGTPPRQCDGHANLSFVYAAARELAPALPPGAVMIIKSTVPVGTGDEVERIVGDIRGDGRLSVVSNPEFLRAGSAIRDFREPDRVVIGAEDDLAREKVARIYRSMFRKSPPIVQTSRRSSELIKYSANALLATKIAFINEIADLCEQAGADIDEVVHGVGLDRRLGPHFLRAGPGFGGSCFRKDALALVKTGEDNAAMMQIVEAVLSSNERRKRTLMRKVASALGAPVRGKRIAILGLTFKPETDDMRESPAIPLIIGLADAGARLSAYDPAGMACARPLLPSDVSYAASPYEALRKADVAVIATEWSEFGTLDLDRVRATMSGNLVVDLRGLYEPEAIVAAGLRYFGIGKGMMQKPAAAMADISSGTRVKLNGSLHPLLEPNEEATVVP